MSEQSEAGHLERQEIIIVRRRGVGDDGHHGGAWKIAFADFMTAMMAFFLVMWLTNSSDNATRKQVAQYFNPIKLNDPSPATRGIKQKDDGADRTQNQNGESAAETNGDPRGNPVAGDETGGEEKSIFRDPYSVLTEIVSESNKNGDGEMSGKPDGSGLPGLNGGEAYRDPFDPDSWQLSPNVMESGGRLEDVPPIEFRTAVLPPEDPMTDPEKGPKGEGVDEPGKSMAEGDQKDKTGFKQAGEDKGAPSGRGKDAAGKADDGTLSKAGKGEGKTGKEGEAEKLRADLGAELSKLGGDLPANVEVVEGKGGITISLADDVTSGMFPVGSAKPSADAILMMEKIAAVLSKRPGEITIRGHTDARPYTSGEYDNWRLSTARAHMAYYMLARGGLDEARVKAIEGFADRELKDPKNPEAAINRRIEIFLTEPSA
ncbi:MotB family protein [Jiella pacifica]|uniref:MotB family protein n=1 Tax=Jiella pacifica TaxID=2696469 RepID=A0A6N9T0J6_9HYPH|nr:MotB family protein [Jiella pacifica]NDW04883.1 MotB family protein [Jiella pacifica]